MRRFFAAVLAFVLMTGAVLAANLLPNGQQTFVDSNGRPYAGGKVYFYIPSTTTPKNTWQDAGQTTLNTNPVTLDASGRATIYGTGSYRQILKDAAGNTIWDRLTADPTAGLGTSWAGTSGGTGNAQTATASSFSSTSGQVIAFIAGYSNTGATTLAVNGGTALAVYKDTSAGPVALTGGEIIAGNLVNVIYDSSLNGFHLLVPVDVASTGTILTNVRLSKSGAYTVTDADAGRTITLGGSAFYTLTFDAPSAYTTTSLWNVVVNEDTARAKQITLGGSPSTSFLLWPQQTAIILRDGPIWLKRVSERWRVSSAVTVYVDPTLGNNSNDCLAAGSGACQTINKAYQIVRDEVDHNGREPKIKLADGNYNESLNITSQLTGYNLLRIEGNLTTPANVLWANASGAAVQVRDYGQVTLHGMKFQSTGGSYAIFAGQYGTADFDTVDFGSYAGGYHVASDSQGSVNTMGSYRISGGANAHLLVTGQGKVVMQGASTVTLSGSPAFATAFMQLNALSLVIMAPSLTFSGSATGPKWVVGDLSLATCSSNTIPGSSSGSADASSKVVNCS